MLATIHGERTLTELDFVRLGKLADQQLPPALAELLDAADVLPSREVPADLVTMNSQVEIEDPATGQRQQITLCYPGDSQPGAGFVSVLSPRSRCAIRATRSPVQASFRCCRRSASACWA